MKHSLQNVLKKVAIKKQFEESEEDEFTQYLESLRRIKPTRFRAKLRKGRLVVGPYHIIQWITLTSKNPHSEKYRDRASFLGSKNVNDFNMQQPMM